MNTVTIIGFLLIVLGVLYKLNDEHTKIPWYIVIVIGILVMTFGSFLYEIIMAQFK